uniref:Putative urease accessory protein uref posttranslational modification n=1 Tax=Ixodes scapularis TaxID=6945 RepID=A0A4D5RXV5_IXOSC
MDATGATSLLLNLLQISDSAFPTGSFAHSGGFEVAGQRGFIDSADKVEQFLVASLENVGSFMTPFMREAHQQWTNPEVIRSLDCKLSASLTNHVASRASIQQGRSLIQTACATYAAPQLVSLQDQIYDEELNGHQAVMYGVLCGFLGIPETQAAISFLFGTLRTMVASAVRLGTTGTLEE